MESRYALLIVALSIALLGAADDGSGLVSSMHGETILDRAFDNLYDCDLLMNVTLHIYDRRGDELIRRVEIARKRIGGRQNVYGRFLEPMWMRGTTILMLEHLDRADDHFVFLPEMQRVRRVSSFQRTDSFMGSDLWFEDFERRRAQDYEIRSTRNVVDANEALFVVEASPVDGAGYDHVDFLIAATDDVLLRVEFFKRTDSPEPFRILETPRSDLISLDAHLIPSRIVVTNTLRGTRTEARFEDIAMNPPIDDSFFTMVALEVGRPIPGLKRPSPIESQPPAE